MLSMTGYTKKDFKIDNLKFSIIIKSLNSTKGLDISIKAPRYLFDLEPAIKKSIDKLLLRGKIDFRIIELTNDKKLTLDIKKLRRHIKILKEVSPDSESGQILNAAVSLPDIFSASSFKLTSDLKNNLRFIISTRFGVSFSNHSFLQGCPPAKCLIIVSL